MRDELSLSKQAVRKQAERNKDECTEALARALEAIDDAELSDVTVHVLRLIAEFVPYQQLTNETHRVHQ